MAMKCGYGVWIYKGNGMLSISNYVISKLKDPY